MLGGMDGYRICLHAIFLCLTPATLADDLPDAGGQLGQPISWVDVPGSDELVYAVQFSKDERLYLTPNESFFPKLGLTAAGTGTIPDVANLNGGKSFARIEKWDPGDAAEWGLWLPQAGELTLQVNMHSETSADKFTLTTGDQSQNLLLRSGKSVVTFHIERPGRYSVVLTCGEIGGRATALNWIGVSGSAAKNAGVIRQRWRPAAAHTRFTNSKTPDKVRLWVMEMDAVPGELDFYSPITTPFGYYGPVWNRNGTVGASFNFSLWSFARGQKAPPIEQLSHLLAIGNSKAKFGGFDHEGTGVKIRDWKPLEGRQGQRQTLALRVEPGKIDNTYFSYFYAADEKRWKLFGVGNQYNKGKPLSSLGVGSFVEVPGPPHLQRSGVWERRMRYRGWIMDNQNRWYPLDRMAGGDVDKDTGLTPTDRGVTDDGWFYLQTGGWYFHKIRGKGDVELATKRGNPKVDYLRPQDIAFLTSIPCQIAVTQIERSRDQARITFAAKNAGADAVATIYWGSSEGLTFKDRWPNHTEVSGTIRDGLNQFILKNIPTDKPLFVRLLLRNGEGQFWSRETVVK